MKKTALILAASLLSTAAFAQDTTTTITKEQGILGSSTTIEQKREPIISTVRREADHITIEPGMVAGCKQTLLGYRGDEVVLTLVHPQQVLPELEGQGTGDYITIHGTPEVNIQITPEYAGGKATQAIAVNVVPRIVEASPGLKNMLDIPMTSALMGPSAYSRRV